MIEIAWPRHPRVRAASTTRSGGVSAGPYAGFNLGVLVKDDPVAVAANRAHLRRELRLEAEPYWLRQVHGASVLKADRLGDLAEADASWTDESGPVCVVLAADCLPVLFAADDGSCVAAAHAGWRGLAAGVLEATLSALPASSARLSAWLGPCIGARAFEVGAEVREVFVQHDPAAASGFHPCFDKGHAGKWIADLHRLARLRLSAAGVSRIHGEPLCTASDPGRFYSFRRDGVCGRMASLVWLAGR